MTDRDPYARLPEPLRTMVRDVDRRERMTARIGGALLVAAGLVLATYVLAYALHRERVFNGSALEAESLVGVLVGLLVAALGAAWLRTSWTPDDRLHRLARAEVVWSYVRVGRSRALVLALGDGNRIFFGYDTAREDEVLAAARAAWPRAAHGYSDALEVAYSRPTRLP